MPCLRRGFTCNRFQNLHGFQPSYEPGLFPLQFRFVNQPERHRDNSHTDEQQCVYTHRHTDQNPFGKSNRDLPKNEVLEINVASFARINVDPVLPDHPACTLIV